MYIQIVKPFFNFTLLQTNIHTPTPYHYSPNDQILYPASYWSDQSEIFLNVTRQRPLSKSVKILTFDF